MKISHLGGKILEYESAVPTALDALNEAKSFQEKGLNTPAEVDEANRQYGQAKQRVRNTKQTIDDLQKLHDSIDWQSLPGAAPRKSVPQTPTTTTETIAAPVGIGLSSQPRIVQPRSVEELVTAATDAKNKLIYALEVLQEAESKKARRANDPIYAESVKKLKSDTAMAQWQLEMIREEYQAQLRLRSLEVKSAEADVRAAQEEMNRIEPLVRSGALPTSNEQEIRHAYDQAALRLEAAQTLLELYQKAGESPDLKPSPQPPSAEDIDKQSGSTESSKADQGSLPTLPEQPAT